VAIVDLGLDPEYFWALTLRELDLLIQRHRIERYRISAHVLAQYAEFNRDEKQRDEPFKIEEFLPGYTMAEPSMEYQMEQLRLQFLKERVITHQLGGQDQTLGIEIKIKESLFQ
jgi:hypothetical protein